MLSLSFFALTCKICLCSVYNDTDMIKLGNRIKNALKKPVGWHEPTLERDTHVYCDELQQLYQYVKMNISEGEHVYNKIKKQGGPPQLKCKIDKNLLKNQYDWSDYEISELDDVLEETNDKWGRLTLALENKNKLDKITKHEQKRKERRRLNADLWQRKLQNETFLKELQEKKRIKRMKKQQKKLKEEKLRKESKQNEDDNINKHGKRNKYEPKNKLGKQKTQSKRSKQVRQIKKSKKSKQVKRNN